MEHKKKPKGKEQTMIICPKKPKRKKGTMIICPKLFVITKL